MDAPLQPQDPQVRMEEVRKRRNREHTNSKYGCAQCKARKVKCDESKPKCRSCARRGTACHYPYDPPNASNGLDELARLAASSPHSASAAYNNSYNANPNLNIPDNDYYQRNARHGHHHISGGSPYMGPASPQANTSYYPQPQVDPFEINMAHFELFHHFTSSTAAAITAGPSTEKLWSTTIPHLALSHRYLMHSILAVSALHIAYTNPDQRATYYAHATAHEDRALALAQADIAQPTAENADALFAFVLTTVYYAFAAPETSVIPGSPVPEEERPKPLQGAVQCINLLRGIRSIMPSVQHWVEAGPLAPLLNMQPISSSSPRRFPDQSTEDHWSKLLLFASTTSTAGPKEFEDIGIYSSAASLLRASSLKVDNISEGELNAPPMWHWAVRLPSEFVERLAQLDAVPLVLVAHWCVLLPQIRHYWWIQGWVDRTMREIGAVLPPEYQNWLEWPLERIAGIRERDASAEISARELEGQGDIRMIRDEEGVEPQTEGGEAMSMQGISSSRDLAGT